MLVGGGVTALERGAHVAGDALAVADGECSAGVDVNPVILSVHAQRGLVDVHRRLCEEALDGLMFPLGQSLMELGDGAEQRGFGQELSDEGVHRLGDAFEREHLGDEQVHGIGLDAGAVLQRAWHLGGEARPGLGVAARAVLDFGVGVTHDLLEHDVDEGTPLVAGAGGVGEVFAAARARIDGAHPDVLAGAGVGAALGVVRGPLALGAGARAGGGVVGALRGGEAGVGGALRGVLLHEHRHQ